MITRKIAFTKKLPFPYKYADIYTLEPGGSPVRITNGSDASTPYDSAGADFSGDGQYLVFDSSRDTNPNSEIYKVDLNDLNAVTRLTDTVGNEDAAWDRANDRIVFTSERNGTFGPFTMDSVGANQTELFPGNPREILYPKWNAAGERIVFIEEYARSDQRVCWADINTLTKNCLTNGERDGAPSFSPALSPSGEEKIVFSRIKDESSELTGDLYTINTDGSGLTKITNSPDGTYYDSPSWSSDGLFIIFSKKVGTATAQIYELELATGTESQITNDTNYDHFAPSYAP